MGVLSKTWALVLDLGIILSTSKHVVTKGAPRFHWRSYSKYLQRKASGNTGFLFTFPVLPYLGYEAYRHMNRSCTVYAQFKVEEVIEQADYLYGSGETEKLYHLLVKYRDSDNAEFLWRLARASRDLALLSSTSAEDRKRLMYEAFDYSRNALEKNESSSAAHKWYAICISDIGDYEGTKIKIGNAYVVKEHLQRAIELNPKDATAIHVLGLWCFAFAELPWYQRKIAAMLFASPPNSTYEEALGYFLKAEEVDANFYSKNLLMLGKSYMMLKDQKSSLLWLSKAKDYPAHTEEDKQIHKEAVQLLKTLGG